MFNRLKFRTFVLFCHRMRLLFEFWFQHHYLKYINSMSDNFGFLSSQSEHGTKINTIYILLILFFTVNIQHIYPDINILLCVCMVIIEYRILE